MGSPGRVMRDWGKLYQHTQPRAGSRRTGRKILQKPGRQQRLLWPTGNHLRAGASVAALPQGPLTQYLVPKPRKNQARSLAPSDWHHQHVHVWTQRSSVPFSPRTPCLSYARYPCFSSLCGRQLARETKRHGVQGRCMEQTATPDL